MGVTFTTISENTPEKLKMYQNIMCEEFFPVNDKIRKMLDKGDEETNVKNAIKYMNERIDDMYTPNDYHYYYDSKTDEDIPYLPNTFIDIDEHYGRE